MKRVLHPTNTLIARIRPGKVYLTPPSVLHRYMSPIPFIELGQIQRRLFKGNSGHMFMLRGVEPQTTIR